MSFTSGPWKVTQNVTPGQFVTDTKVRDAREGVICVMHINARENARLIAASPDLLAALEQLLHPMSGDDDIETARELVAQVKGGVR